MRTGIWLRNLVVGAIVLGGIASARASMVQALELAELVHEADHVVVARVFSQHSHYDEQGHIVTDVQMQVEDAAKGSSVAGASVTVRKLGGIVGDMGMRIEGEPSFDDGELVLLFGAQPARAAVLRPVGMSQGAMRVFEESGVRWVRSANGGVSLVRKDASGKLVPQAAAVAEPRRLDDVLSEVRQHVVKQKAATR